MRSAHASRAGALAASNPTPRALNRFEYATWVAVTVIVVCSYFWALGRIPPGLFIDETSVGFNARSIGRSLTDQYGVFLPLFFQAHDDYKSPVYVYTAAVTEALLGPSPFSVRLPAALYALGTAALIFLLVKDLTGRVPLARWMSTLGLLVPSTFTYGRQAVSEVSCLPFWLALGLLALRRFERVPTLARAIFAGAALGFFTYTYTTARLLAPLYVAAATLCFWALLPSSRGKLLGLVGAAAAIGLPTGVYMLMHPGELDKRFQILSVASDHPAFSELMRRIVGTYFQHLASPDFLFLTGDRNLRHNVGVGFLPLWMALPLLAGFWAAWKRRQSPTVRFLLVATVLAPIPVSLTSEGLPHASRMLHYALLATLLASLALSDWLDTRPKRSLITLALVGSMMEGGFFLHRYFFAYPARAQSGFSNGISEALEIAFRHREANEPLFVPDPFFVWNGTYLDFFGDLDADRRRTVGFENIFTSSSPGPFPPGSLVVLPAEWDRPERAALVGRSTRAGRSARADNSTLYFVYRVRRD